MDTPEGVEILLSDTVGFVKHLPHQLVASFKATLEEAVNADLLLHVIDTSNPEVTKQMEAVKVVLSEIGCGEKPVLDVFNKTDIVKNIVELEILQTMFPAAISISAKTGVGLVRLAEAVTEKYKGGEVLLRVVSSQADDKVQSYLRAHGKIVEEHYLNSCVIIDARLGRNQLPALQKLQPQTLEIIS